LDWHSLSLPLRSALMRVNALVRRFWFPALLFFLALVPRLAAIGRYVTPDELGWVYRSILFREALLHGNWSETLTAGHPGVITTWLGGLSITLQLLLHPGSASAYDFGTKLAWLAPDNAAAFEQLAVFLSGGRIAVAIVTALGLVAMLPLISQIYSRQAAVLACLLMALDPFLIGLSGLFHVDALMTTFATLSLLGLALLVKRGPRRGLWLSIGSGGMAGLAVLTKSPALLLLPIAGLAHLLMLLWPQDRRERTVYHARNRLGPVTWSGFVYLGAFAVTLLCLLPALWSSPASVLNLTGANAGRHLEEALRPTYFLGEVALEHGWAFYPLNLALRLSPVVSAGLLLAFALLIFNLARNRRWPARWSWLLVVWVAILTIGVSLAAKKFDRYALPIVPTLILFAALGWQRLRLLLYRGRVQSQRTFNAGAILIVFLQALYLISYMPYPLSAYSWLLGGPAVAEQLVSIGWGEGVSAAGAWLDQLSDNREGKAAADSLPSLAPYYPGRSMRLDPELTSPARYLVLSAGSRQIDPAGIEAVSAASELIHTVEFGGLEQAWVFAQEEVPQVAVTPLANPYHFGDQVELQALSSEVTGNRLHVRVRWALEAVSSGLYDVRLTLLDSAGESWASLETPLLNEVYFYPPDWSEGEAPEVSYALELPPGIPPANYHVALALFEADSGIQLPLLARDGSPAGMQYAGDEFAVLPGSNEVDPASAVPTVFTNAEMWPGSLMLLGHEPLPAGVANGDDLALDVTWQATTTMEDELLARFSLGDTELAAQPLSRYPTSSWQAGETIREKYRLPVPADMPAGRYPLRIAVCQDGMDAACEETSLGEVEVYALDRLFSVPENIQFPVQLRLTGRGGEEIILHGAALERSELAPGEPLQLTLYWQSLEEPVELYTAFVHMVNSDGPLDANIAQGDQWPGGLPSTTWAPGQVIVDRYAIELPADMPAGGYLIAVGLYTAADGARLEMRDAAGEAVPENRFFLPLVVEVR
jgi:hypothetical protein